MKALRWPQVFGVLVACSLLATRAPGSSAEDVATVSPAETDTEVSSFEATDLFELEYVSDPQVSPDGRSVVYVVERPDVMADEWFSTLWWVDAEGGPSRPLTRGQVHDTSPRWSPDGRRLAFVSDLGSSYEIRLLSLSDGELSTLARLSQEPSGIAWSPDGVWLAYAALEPRPRPAFADLPLAPEGARWAKPPRIDDRLVHRIDGVGNLDGQVMRLYVVPSDGGTPRRVTRDTSSRHEVGLDLANRERLASAVWTPDGRFLITSANHHPDAELRPLDTELYEVSLEEGSIRSLTDRRGPDLAPVVSPDGRWIAYVGFDDQKQGYQPATLWVMARDGSSPPRALTGDLDREVFTPRWTGDSRALLFQYHDHGVTRIAIVDLEGRRSELSRHLSDGYGTYGGGTFSLSPSGVYAYTSSTASEPGQIAIATVGEGGARVLTSINRDLLSRKVPGEVEELWIRSAKDERAIQGWLIKPPDFDPSRRYPLILEIHGGPFREYGDRFDIEKQVWAARGYLVLYVNHRGSTGYGEAFAQLIHHAYPGDEIYDLEAAVSAVVDKGWADPENLFVTGASGGGMLSCWLTAHSRRYRAAVAAYPLTHWTSAVLGSDLSALMVNHWFPGPPWLHPRHYEQRSPLFRVGQVSTPTMLIVGDEDYRTPASEAEQYFAALRHRGVDSALVRLPGEPHYSEHHPSHQVARVLLTVGWFDHHRSRGEKVIRGGGEPR